MTYRRSTLSWTGEHTYLFAKENWKKKNGNPVFFVLLVILLKSKSPKMKKKGRTFVGIWDKKFDIFDLLSEGKEIWLLLPLYEHNFLLIPVPNCCYLSGGRVKTRKLPNFSYSLYCTSKSIPICRLSHLLIKKNLSTYWLMLRRIHRMKKMNYLYNCQQD